MKTNLFLSSIAVLFLTICHAQPTTPADFGLEETTLTSGELGEVHYYVTMGKQDSLKPLLVYLDGSGSMPLFQNTDQGIGSSVLLNMGKLSSKYHVVLISKPGVPFMDEVKMNEQTGYPMYDTPQEYTDRLSLSWRVDAADAVINDCMKKYKVNTSKVAIIGISEGYQVGAELLSKNKSITHSILMVGNGLNQLYDFIILNRMEAETGKISAQEAQKNIDSLHHVFKDIYADPTSTEKQWYGHTYLRWASFCSVDPVDAILEADIPIYLVSCSDDKNTTAISGDFVALEAIRQQKTNIKSVVYPYNHSFRESVFNEDGQIIDKVDHMTEVLDASLLWLEYQK